MQCGWGPIAVGGRTCPQNADHALVFGCLNLHVGVSYYCREHYDYWVKILDSMHSWSWKCACGLDIEEWLGGNFPVG